MSGYKVYHRTWWTNNPSWPNGLEPGAGRKTTIRARVDTIEQARDIAQVWNANHEPGRLSRKAEFESL